MNPDQLQNIEAERQALLGQLNAAEAALRTGLLTQGSGSNARAHMERAHAHIQEACICINEGKPIRTVPQLVDDLNRVQRAMDAARRQRSQHI
jgi:K+-transporting ATPase c subunit